MSKEAQSNHIYLAIDLKSFYASVECVDRNLDALSTNLVVADASRTDKTICLAVSPSLKAQGIPGRPRLFEVVQKVKTINEGRLREAIHKKIAVKKDGKWDFSGESFDGNALLKDPSLKLNYIVATPRMARYMEVSSKVYAVYLRFVSPEDIHVYSIDEVFMDITAYLQTYHMSPRELAMTMIREVLYTTGITATAGIGTNLYLAKLAMDIVAKHIPPDKDGVRIAELDEISYRYLLWDHKPLTDFWRTGPGTAARLEARGITTMGELARASIYNEEWFYKTFGIDGEIIIDHAWGLEPCTIRQIKDYIPENNSICESQILPEGYSFDKGRIIVQEMSDTLAFQLMGRNLVTDSVTLMVHFDRGSLQGKSYSGEIHMDYYGRPAPKPVHGTAKFPSPTNLSSQLRRGLLEIYDKMVDPGLLVRRVSLSANQVVRDEGVLQMDFFTDMEQLAREKKLQEAVLSLKMKYNKNAVLKGTNLLEGATMKERNNQVGGHKA